MEVGRVRLETPAVGGGIYIYIYIKKVGDTGESGDKFKRCEEHAGGKKLLVG